MTDQVFNQAVPFGVGFRGCHVGIPPKDFLLTAGERRRHEAQFHKGTDIHGEQIVIKFINVLPVMDGGAVLVFGINAHVVVEQSVKADVMKTDFVLAEFQLALPIGSQSLVGTAGADALAPDVAARALDGLIIRRNNALGQNG